LIILLELIGRSVVGVIVGNYMRTGSKIPFDPMSINSLTFCCQICIYKKRLEAAECEISRLNIIINNLEKSSSKVESSFADIAKPQVITEKDRALLKNVKAPCSSINTDQTILTPPQLQQAAEEVSEIEKRKLNVIVSGFTASENDVNNFIQLINESHNLSYPMTEDKIAFAV